MFSNYTFLNDHSYSLRPVIDDNDNLSLNKREDKTKKRQRSSNRTNKIPSTTTRTVSIDRSSSDKENHSSNTSITVVTNTRVSPRTAMINSRTQSGKKSTPKTNVKSTSSSITKKKNVINRNKTKFLDSTDILPSLSIEERVKLRRTKPITQPSVTKTIEKKSRKMTKKKLPTVQQDIKQIRQSIKNNSTSKQKVLPTKTKKLFLGSGLDLDNIVLGNRQRRNIQT